ncbi:hypothetical protein AVEN_69732-1 [Araneus ventricosus]|uniref:Uncharacterized protein n=1 Tax=Araneus ventricosus TaxID=182803 RepID=A0A4Y2VA59_ARAVE|nr:hypothetical protein AVEN_69732-1 [Araneus ventricosus]
MTLPQMDQLPKYGMVWNATTSLCVGGVLINDLCGIHGLYRMVWNTPRHMPTAKIYGYFANRPLVSGYVEVWFPNGARNVRVEEKEGGYQLPGGAGRERGSPAAGGSSSGSREYRAASTAPEGRRGRPAHGADQGTVAYLQ